jgi:2-amino-4-hydroxy-6-hydroxymethyldihydropteridine diphosphokinase
MINVFLLLGSNLGDRNSFLNNAITCIENEIAPVLDKSSVYETQSWGKEALPDYLNQVIMLQTVLTARQVLEKILSIELKMGRRRDEKWNSRTIDIDILFYGNNVIKEPDLIVPHPELHNRRFTLSPLVDIAPDLIHPVFNKTVSELKSDLKDDLIVKKL